VNAKNSGVACFYLYGVLESYFCSRISENFQYHKADHFDPPGSLARLCHIFSPNYDASRLYVASAVGEPTAMSSDVYTLSATDLTLLQSIRVDDIGHITDITEEPDSGDLWVIGYTMPQYLTFLPGNLSQMPQFYDPYLAEVPYALDIPYDSNNVDATCVSEVNDPNNFDLALPLSIVWSGTETVSELCGGANLDNIGAVDFADFAILASQWHSAPDTPSADIAPKPITDNFVDILDLTIIAQYWLDSECTDP